MVQAAGVPTKSVNHMPDTRERDELAALERKIEAAKLADRPEPREQSHVSAAQLAWRMVLELVIGLVFGFGIGFGLDRLFGTLPLFLVVFTLLGFAAGVRTMMRTAEEVRTRNAGLLRPSATGDGGEN